MVLPLAWSACADALPPDEDPVGPVPDAPHEAAPPAGAHGGHAPPPGPLGPTVLATLPQAQATEVELGAVIEATFSAELSAQTVHAGTFTVERDGATVAGMVSYDAAARAARFTALAPLDRLATYTATTAGVSDTVGVGMAAAHAWTFTTAARGWEGRHPLPDAAGEPTLVTAPDGALTMVWIADGASGAELWTTRLAPGGSWATPRLLDRASIIHPPSLAVGAAGTVAAVWTALDGDQQAVRYALGGPGDTWTAPERVDSGRPGHRHQARVALDASGDATVLWLELDEAQSAFARRRLATGGWQDEVLLEHDDGPDKLAGIPHPHHVHDLYAVVDGAGVVTAIWRQEDVDHTPRVWASRLLPGTGWSERVALGKGSGGLAAPVVDASGTVTVLWMKAEGGAIAQVAARGQGGTWSEPEAVIDGPSYDHHLEAEVTGAVTLVYAAQSPQEHALMARRFLPGTGWQPATRLATSGMMRFPPAAVSAGADGQLHVMWRRSVNSGVELGYRRLVPAVGWTVPAAVLRTTSQSEQLGDPRLSARPDGSAVAVWPRIQFPTGARSVEAMYYR